MSGNDPADMSLLQELEQLRACVKVLQQRQKKHTDTDAALEECIRLSTLNRDVSIAFIESTSLQQSLRQCAQALVTHLGAAFARIWTFNKVTAVLELQASAGLYTHIDGAHSRIPLGSLKIGLIASERQPHLTNNVIGDPRVSDQEWARREGMVAFAGYPLLVEGELVGVMALFARTPLSTTVLDVMASVSNMIAVGIERKLVEQERLQWLELAERARVQAETALQMRNDFLSSVSHDLKTPLAAMRANIQLVQRRIKRGDVDPSWLAGRLGVLETATMKMTGMVEDLLDIAKLQAGQQLDLDLRPLHLVPLLQQICAEMQEATHRHQILLTVPGEDLLLQADTVRLDRVLTNLLANAIKYSPNGGQILVTLLQEQVDGEPWAVLRIQDQGLGIPASDLPHIFQPFYRATNVAGSIQGTGVGLASVAQVVALHGGSIAVESQEGQGSTFVIRLPCLHEQVATPSISTES